MAQWRWTISLVVLAMLVGCAPQPEVLEATPLLPTIAQTSTMQPTEPSPTLTIIAEMATATLDITPTATGTPEPTATATATSVPVPLTSEGPWLVILGKTDRHGPELLWAVNADGTGLTQLSTDRVVRFTTTSSHGRVAYITTTSDDYSMTDLVLHVVELPNTQPILSLPLTSERTAYVAGVQHLEGEPWTEEIARALTEAHSMDWSPDGTTLAFAGAIDGDSSDVYTYSAITHEVRRITSGEFEVTELSWSPDGNYILHVAVRGFGTGAGLSVDSVWAAAANGSGAAKVYGGEEALGLFNGGESLGPWLNNHQFLAVSWLQTCGDSRLRIVSLSGATTPLWNDCFSGMAMDPVTQNIMLTVPLDLAERIDKESGIYLIDGQTHAVRLISPVDAGEITWERVAKRFVVQPSRGPQITFSAHGESLGEVPPLPPPHQAGYVAWSDDGSLIAGVFDGVYIARAPEFEVIPVGIVDAWYGWLTWVYK